jgi:putative protease
MPDRRCEILAPAGSPASLAAALAAGADAVYFGVDEGWNARARADNFALADLPTVMTQIHAAGARGYLTMNTLIFEPELTAVERVVRAAAAAGVDALIVQDPAVAAIARAVCPALALHASTQMTLSAPAAAAVAARLGVTRIVAPRELSIEEVAAFAAASPIELEVFIHGALCVSWSGQCLTSEAWGGRSANRGQCAQSCRLPYDLVVDGEVSDLGEVRYLLSPQDLAGAPAVPALVAAGVASLKIEGRLKGPAYVAATVAGYAAARDAAVAGASAETVTEAAADALAAMELAYSRGPSLGFLGGVDHQRLVVGRAPKHRGAYLGRVLEVGARSVVVVDDDDGRPWTGGLAALERPAEPTARRALLPDPTPRRLDPRPGLGVVFDAGHPEADEDGGPIFSVVEVGPRRWQLGFGTPGPDLTRLAVGTRVWVTSDPAQHRAAERLVATAPTGRIAVALTVRGQAGAPLVVTATAGQARATAATALALTAARAGGLDRALLADKLGGLGGTRFHLADLDLTELAPGLHLPVSALKDLRRRLVADLEAALDRVERVLAPAAVVEDVRAAAWAEVTPPVVREPDVVPLCRTDEQLDALLAAGAREVELDWMELVGLGRAVARARAAGATVVIATPRVIKPGEERILAHLCRLEPDALLVRSWAALALAVDAGVPCHGDFSLNVTNAITAGFVAGFGLRSVTAAHDLDTAQLDALIAAIPRGLLAVTVHHHIPTFHTEHCVYAHLLSAGRDYRSCGRPCEAREVALRDRVGLVHPVVVDVGCRNTVFGAQAQSAAGLVPTLVAGGVARLRCEFVRERGADAARVWTSYRELARGQRTPAEVVRAAAALEQFGVTRGTMRVLR